MSIFKRFSATVVSRLDNLVGEIEDHDAVVEATIKDIRKKIAAAKVQQANINKEKEKIEQKVNELQNAVTTWRNRALRCTKDDEEKALICLSRAKSCQQQAEALVKTMEQYKVAGKKLDSDIQLSEKKLGEIKQKLVIMRARQTTSKTIQATNKQDEITLDDLEKTFDRWEANILETEMMNQDHDTNDILITDDLDNEFIAEEVKAELAEELSELIREQDNDNH